MYRPKILIVFLVVIHAAVFARADNSTVADFNYLKIDNEKVVSLHSLQIKMSIPVSFEALEQINYKAKFHDHPFNISMASFVDQDKILAFHAEQLSDSSGILDYSYMTPTKFSGVDFHYNAKCATLTNEDVMSATDLSYFAKNGFHFNPHIYLYQLFKTSEDGNAEVVLTYGEKVTDCSGKVIHNKFDRQIRENLENLIRVEEYDFK